MYIDQDPILLEPDDVCYKKQTLRNAVICIAWLKITTVVFSLIVYYYVMTSSKGAVSMVIQIMLIANVPLQIIHGVTLFFGAVNKKPLALDIAIWLCLALASYNTVLGVLGAGYFLRIGHNTTHYVLVVVFAMLAISLIVVLCHDILVIFAYKQLLLTFPEPDCRTNTRDVT